MTKYFETLKINIDKIKKGLRLDIEIEYDKVDDFQELIKGYIVLVHAQIEYYFEELAISIAQESYFEYENNKNIQIPLLSISSVNIFEISYPESFSDNRPKSFVNLNDRIKRIYSKYFETVKMNHGITEKYLINLFWPLGVDVEIFDTNLLAMLASLASQRGEIAHARFNESLLNFEIEERKVLDILKELEDFDGKIEKYMK